MFDCIRLGAGPIGIPVGPRTVWCTDCAVCWAAQGAPGPPGLAGAALVFAGARLAFLEWMDVDLLRLRAVVDVPPPLTTLWLSLVVVAVISPVSVVVVVEVVLVNVVAAKAAALVAASWPPIEEAVVEPLLDDWPTSVMPSCNQPIASRRSSSRLRL